MKTSCWMILVASAQLTTFQQIKRPVYLAFFCFVVVLSACSDRQASRPFIHISGNTMGTTYNVKVVPAPNQTVDKDKLGSLIDEALITFNQVASTYIEDSEISQLNRAKGNEALALSETMAHLLAISLEVSEKSDGAFDPTVMPLVNAWGFGPEKRTAQPSDEQIAMLLARLGYDKLSINEATLEKHSNVSIDLSAMAKGYGVDEIARLLQKEGFTNYMVEIGGEVFIKGTNPDGRGWVIGVEKPALAHSGALQAVSGDGIGIATSGEYRNYYEENGRRVSHTLDPKTGRPIHHNLASVSVITPKGCAYADAYATAINVLGPDKGMDLAEREGLGVLMIISDEGEFRVKYSPEFEQYRVNRD